MGEQLQKYLNMRAALSVLGAWLREDLALMENLEADFEKSALYLHPDAPGGALMRTGVRGKPVSIVTVLVKELLQKRFPEWDGESPFPGRDGKELRAWLYAQLTTEPLPRQWTSGSVWAEATAAYPFDLEHIDPVSGGPLSKIIGNLRRKRKRKRKRK